MPRRSLSRGVCDDALSRQHAIPLTGPLADDVDALSVDEPEFSEILGVHEHDIAPLADAAVPVVQTVDGRVELVMRSEGLQDEPPWRTLEVLELVDRDDGLALRAVEPALVAPASSTTWNVEGMKLDAGGREFVLALVRDFDGDGKKDALAVVRPPPAERKPGASTGDLVFIGGGENAHAAVIASGPALAAQASCAPVARLEKIGPRSAFAEMVQNGLLHGVLPGMSAPSST